MKKLCSFLKNFIIFLYIVLIIFVTVCLISYNEYQVSVIGDSTFIPVIDEDLEPDYTVGDLLIINRKNPAKIKKDEKVFFYMKRFGEPTVNYATVENTEVVSPTEVTFTVNGDYKFSSSNYIGKVDDTIIIPKVGRILNILESKWGFLFLGVFPSLLAFLYTLHSIVTEIIENSDDKSKKKKKKKKTEHTEEVKEEVLAEKKSIEEKIENIPETKDEVEEVAETSENVDKVVETKEMLETQKEDALLSESNVTKITEDVIEENPVAEVKESTEKIEETKEQETVTNEPEEVKTTEISEEEKRKAAIEAKVKSMTEEEKRALIKAKLDSMTEEEKRALIEAKKKKLEAEKNNKGE